MPQPQNNENSGLSADFVFKDSNQNVGTKTKIITFSTPVQITPTSINSRLSQEKIFMENFTTTKSDLELTKSMFSKKNRDEENILPRSCFKVFASGVVNNLKEMAKCFGLKR
jgi:hypothetical protein